MINNHIVGVDLEQLQDALDVSVINNNKLFTSQFSPTNIQRWVNEIGMYQNEEEFAKSTVNWPAYGRIYLTQHYLRKYRTLANDHFHYFDIIIKGSHTDILRQRIYSEYKLHNHWEAVATFIEDSVATYNDTLSYNHNVVPSMDSKGRVSLSTSNIINTFAKSNIIGNDGNEHLQNLRKIIYFDVHDIKVYGTRANLGVIKAQCGKCQSEILIKCRDTGQISCDKQCHCFENYPKLELYRLWQSAMDQFTKDVLDDSTKETYISDLLILDLIHIVGTLIIEKAVGFFTELSMGITSQIDVVYARHIAMILYHMTCGNNNFEPLNDRWFSLSPIYRTFAFSRILLTETSMCRKGQCKCSDKKYGDILNKIKTHLYSDALQTNQRLAAYGQADLAISHCWGDRLMLGMEWRTILYQIERHCGTRKIWLDLAQDRFDNLKCAKEYTGTVIIVEKTLYKNCDS